MPPPTRIAGPAPLAAFSKTLFWISTTPPLGRLTSAVGRTGARPGTVLSRMRVPVITVDFARLLISSPAASCT
ncbi:MAG: hypothetical protein ACRYGM_05860 [Janthinobacterium lividum]